MQITGVLEPPKRNKELSDKELRSIKMNIQKLSISPKEDIYYSLVTKDSKTGFFSNDRLLLINTKEKELFYISKLPQGLIPFQSQAEVNSIKFKEKVTRDSINKKQISLFKCASVPGKNATFQVEFKKGSEDEKWVMVAGNTKTMNEWVDIINKVLILEEPKPKTPQKPQQQNIQISEVLPKVPSQRLTRPMEENQKLFSDTSVPQNPPPPQSKPLEGNSLNQSIPSSKIQESQIANLPYSDHVTELKHLRGQTPGLFKTDNVLSKPRLPQQPQIENNQNRLNTNPSFKNNPNFSKENSKNNSYEVDSRLIVDSRANESQLPQSRFQQNANLSKQSYNQQPYNENPIKNPSRRQFDRYSRERQQQQPLIKIYSVENSRGGQSGLIGRSRESKNLNNDSKQNDEYQPVFAKSKTNQIGQISQKNIVIKEQDSKEDLSVVRDPSKPSGKLNVASGLLNVTSGKGSNYVSSNNFSSKRSLNRKRWNEVFAESNSKLQIYEEFIEASFNVVRQIINELPLDKNQKEFLPIESKEPYFTYYNEGIIITLHYFENGKNVPTNNYSSNAPLLYDQSTYQLLKRQFYNYNLILNVTANEGFIKVPLCAYFEYKGLIALCKAQIPQNFSEITPKRYQKQFDIIQNQIHVRFMYGSFNSYLHPSSKYLILDNMRQLIPQLPLHNNDQHFFRKEFLLSYPQIIEDMESCNEAHHQIIQQAIIELANRLETLETYIVCSTDLARVFHETGLSLGYIPLLLQQIRAPYVKKVLTTQLASCILTSIFRSEINHLMATFPREEFSELSLEAVNGILLDSCHTLIELMFGYSNAAESIWKVIVEQCSLKYRIAISKEDLIPGYLLSAAIDRFGLLCDFRRSAFNKHNVQFFVKSGNIPKDLLLGFRMRTRRYDLAPISPLVRHINDILAVEPTVEHFRVLVDSLQLKSQSIPNFLEREQAAILSYLCNFVPYSEHEEFQHIGIYNMVVLQPHSYFSVKVSLLAVKWCVKKRLAEEAFKIYEMKEAENGFWLGEYNPAISEFYDFFSMYHASLGRYDQAVQLAKLSLKNTSKALGGNQLPVADKHYQLGNIYFKMGRKDDSLREYSKTREILTAHNQVHISQYAVILLKLGVLYLNFGKISECVNCSLEALKIFGQTQSNQQDEIGTFQILSRCYQITKKNTELLKIGDLVGEKFNETQNPQIFERMAKIVLYSRLKNLSSSESKAFLIVIGKLQEQHSTASYTEAFTFLHRKCQSELLMKKVVNYLDNIASLYEEASKKDLFRRYKSLDVNTRTQAEEMLVTLDAIGVIIGYGYLIGSLRESE